MTNGQKLEKLYMDSLTSEDKDKLLLDAIQKQCEHIYDYAKEVIFLFEKDNEKITREYVCKRAKESFSTYDYNLICGVIREIESKVFEQQS